MKFVLPIIIVILLTGASHAQLKHLQGVSSVPAHPRIMLLKGEEKGIQSNIDADANWKKIHQAILGECDKMIDLEPLKRIQIGRRLLDKSREALRRIFYLSYAYRMTHEKKYLDRAETELLTVSQFSDWNPSHFLDVGEMTMAVSIGYDWLFNDLKKSSLSIIKEAILKKGIEPSLDAKNNYWLKSSNNWNQVCNAGMSFGALAIYEDNPELAKQIIDRAVETIKLPMEDYKPDGAYPEGYGYWGYGTSFNVLFLNALKKSIGNEFGLADSPGFLKTAGYYQNMVGASGKTFNYSDAGSGSGGVSPAMFWFANRTQDASLLYNEKNLLEKGTVTLGRDRILPAAMIWGAGFKFENVSAPKKLIWVGKGKNPVAMMRSSWTDPKAIYVGLKAGSPSVSHGHMDVGSFVMDALGQRWSMDLGMQDYESLESKGVKLWGKEQDAQRWEVYRYNNFAHSTLTFNNELQWVPGYAPMTSFTDKPMFLSATTDVTPVYKSSVNSAKRGVAIVEQKYVLIKDEIVGAEKPGVVRWVMLTPAEVKISGDGGAELSQNGKKLHLKVIQPAGAVLKTWSTDPGHEYDAPNPGTMLVGFEVNVPANTKVDLSVLLVPDGVVLKKEPSVPKLSNWKK
jgi:hypothetical protein